MHSHKPAPHTRRWTRHLWNCRLCQGRLIILISASQGSSCRSTNFPHLTFFWHRPKKIITNDDFDIVLYIRFLLPSYEYFVSVKTLIT